MKSKATIKVLFGAILCIGLIACSNAEDTRAEKHNKVDQPLKLASSIAMPEQSGEQGIMKEEHASDSSSHNHAPHWSYSGAGAPYNWGDLKEDFSTCKAGRSQSPIDISTTTITSLPAIAVDYKETGLDIVNNGHSIQVNYAPGSSITVSGKSYALLQFHFHAPSEHTIGGKGYPMVAHLVHKADNGQLAVIGVMMREGRENPFITMLWEHLPGAAGEESKVGDVKFNVAEFLPRDPTYFNYTGSLTTPPCSEGVNWMFMAAPVQLSAEQIKQFTMLYSGNNRPVQPLNGRVIRLSN